MINATANAQFATATFVPPPSCAFVTNVRSATIRTSVSCAAAKASAMHFTVLSARA